MSCPWSTFTQANETFCEAAQCSLVATPVNTYSNLFYAITFFIIFKYGKNTLLKPLFLSVTLAAATGSSLFHATLIQATQSFGIAARALYPVTLLITSITSFLSPKRLDQKSFWLLAIPAAFVLTLASALVWSKAGFSILAISTATFALIEKKRKTRADKRLLNLWLISLVLGLLCWYLDKQVNLCRPHSLWQWHSLWHIFFAVSILPIYFYLEQVWQEKTSSDE